MSETSHKKWPLKSWLAGLAVLVVLGAVFFPLPNRFLEKPGTTEDLAQFVTVDGQEDELSGAFYLTTVRVQQATFASLALAHFSDFTETVTKEELMGTNDNEEYQQIQRFYMDSSKNAAMEQALKLADIPYEMTFKGIYVLSVEEQSHFNDILSMGDIITAVDGHQFASSAEFINYVSSKKVGDKVSISYIHNDETKQATAPLMELPTTKKAGLGVSLVDHTVLVTDVKIAIDAQNIGGPSAGLMFTLETYSLLTNQDLRQGHQIAGTGTINTDGTVGRIGGIDKKVASASKQGIDIFFAPDDELTTEMLAADPSLKTNYEEALAAAEKLNTSMKIVPVKTVQDALDYLATLKQ